MRLEFARRTLELDGPPHLMGIVNVTPDSFYDRGLSAAPAEAVQRAQGMIEAGATIIDIGGMTAQPGSELSIDEELHRVLPVLEGIRALSACVVSVDTYRAGVAAAALDAGADLINDHTGLRDPAMADTVAARGGGLVITHLRLEPKQEREGRYPTSPRDIAEFLVERATYARAAGVRRTGILVDPGLGFGKTTETDLATLRALPMLVGLGYPLLLACSHKEVTSDPLGHPESAMEGTAAIVALAAYHGVHVLRVHDLPFMARVARMGWLLRNGA